MGSHPGIRYRFAVIPADGETGEFELPPDLLAEGWEVHSAVHYGDNGGPKWCIPSLPDDARVARVLLSRCAGPDAPVPDDDPATTTNAEWLLWFLQRAPAHDRAFEALLRGHMGPESAAVIIRPAAGSVTLSLSWPGNGS
jgi:hypothetical protein